ncbi:hypothetical protein VNI00_013143 [Paramarasmius palmivorus]|uniref:Alpha/beta-hydrolase n=1 Tax=Paramarasmius palmivorus TaxID=297713 RepID=A0AAW0C3I3_9AGAR
MTSKSRSLRLVSALLFGLRLAHCAETDTDTDTWSESSWASIEPTKELAWQPCYDTTTFECGRLQVPLNYSDPSGQSAAIALIRIKANISISSPEYRGPVIYNPGGPGGSGINDLRVYGKRLAKTVGPEFDIVSFDPRGVARSTPKVSYFETPEERALWGASINLGQNDSAQYVSNLWARSKIEGILAGERLADVLPHIQTDHTARDMLRINEAHGREKIQYWGISYGSVLGATFAAMFPDKVERLVIDGVIDVAGDYYTTNWKDNFLDSDKALQWFFKDCHAAGPSLCGFYAESPEAIEARLNRLYTSVLEAPIAVRTAQSYGLIDYTLLRSFIFNPGLYFPFATWSVIATGLADLEAGNGTTLWSLSGQTTFQCTSCNPEKQVFDYEQVPDAQTAIRCNDGDVVPSSLEEARKHYKESEKVSGWVDLAAGARISCSHWPEIPKTFFRGPISGNTSHPILLIGNSADPVTPLHAAHVVSQGFPGSVVLTQDYAGHAAISAPSFCTENALRTYFLNGTLPEPGTVCPVEGTAFTNPKPLSEAAGDGLDA